MPASAINIRDASVESIEASILSQVAARLVIHPREKVFFYISQPFPSYNALLSSNSGEAYWRVSYRFTNASAILNASTLNKYNKYIYRVEDARRAAYHPIHAILNAPDLMAPMFPLTLHLQRNPPECARLTYVLRLCIWVGKIIIYSRATFPRFGKSIEMLLFSDQLLREKRWKTNFAMRAVNGGMVY